MENRLLITGGAGFIGSNFTYYWCKTYPNHRVVVLDALTYAGNKETLADLQDRPNFRFVQGDICDRSLVFAAKIKVKNHFLNSCLEKVCNQRG